MKQTDVVKDFDAVITQVRRGAEIVVEANDQPVAVIRAPERPGRPLDECIAIARARQPGGMLDEDYLRDLESRIADRKPLDATAWD